MIKRLTILGLVFMSLFSTASFSQKVTDQQFNSWWSYAGNHTISKRWGFLTYISIRRNDFVKNWQQSIFRTGPNFKVNDHFIITPGVDWLVNFPYGKQPGTKKFNEYRTFQQFILKNKIGFAGLTHRYRIEQRFVSGLPMRNRLRYKLIAQIPFGEKNPFSLVLFDEVFLNTGRYVMGQYLEQNWMYAGLSYSFNKFSSIKLGYMNQYLIKSDNIHIENNHTLSFAIGYNYLRKP